MKRPLFILLAFTSFAIALPAAPTPSPGPQRTSTKNEKKGGTQETLAQSANGWSYLKGEWVHPDGYKYVKGQVLRTTARPGRTAPRPPGKLALENADKLMAKTAPDPANKAAANKAAADKAAADKAAERQRNLAPRPAPQTGSHL